MGLQAALDEPSLVRGVLLLDVALRRQHRSKQPPWQRLAFGMLQWALRSTPLGALFFARLASRDSARAVLCQCYGRPDAVDDSLVSALLAPARLPGAPAVFLDCVCNSGGPLPEEQLRVSDAMRCKLD